MAKEVECYILLLNSEGEPERVNIGGLHSEISEGGAVSNVTIELYDHDDLSEYEPYFEPVRDFVPRAVQIEDGTASFLAFDADESECFAIDPEGDASSSDEEGYRSSVWAAQRLYERVTRGEPIFAGYLDVERHRAHWRVRGGRMLDALATVAIPPGGRRRKPGQKRQEVHSPSTFGRAILTPVEATSERPAITLDVPLQADLFPARVGQLFGLAEADGNRSGIVVDEHGGVQLYGMGPPTELTTNLMATRVLRGAQLLFWRDGYRRSCRYAVSSVLTL